MVKINVTQLCPPSKWVEITPAIESEKAVLGGLLLDSSLFVQTCQRVAPPDFHCETHKEIYFAMWRLFEKHKAFDAAMVCDLLNAKDGDIAYIYNLANECCSTANICAHCDIIREKSVQRQLIASAKQIKGTIGLVRDEPQIAPAKEHLVLFFAELSAEINSTQVTVEYLNSVMVEVNKALTDSICQAEEEEAENDAG